MNPLKITSTIALFLTSLAATPAVSEQSLQCGDVGFAYDWIRCEHAETILASIRKPQPGVECKILYDGHQTHYVVNADLPTAQLRLEEVYTNVPDDMFVLFCEQPIPLG